MKLAKISGLTGAALSPAALHALTGEWGQGCTAHHEPNARGFRLILKSTQMELLAPTLERLDLSGNLLAALPRALSELTRLDALDVAANALARLRDAERLAPLARLTTLRLSANPVCDEPCRFLD